MTGRKKSRKDNERINNFNEYGKSYKTYKIFPLHHKIFYACLTVCQRDKITDYLINEMFKGQISNNIPKYDKAELLDVIVSCAQKKSIHELILTSNNERVSKLKKLMREENLLWDGGGVRTHLQTYSYNKTHQLIAEQSKNTNTIGAFLELAIEYYICQVSDLHFTLILLAFQYDLKEDN